VFAANLYLIVYQQKLQVYLITNPNLLYFQQKRRPDFFTSKKLENSIRSMVALDGLDQ
jgi:hypothetical protein